MINCPNCNGVLEVSAERIFVQSVSFEHKAKGKGIKKKNIKLSSNSPTELRVFFECDTCNYTVDNLWSGSITISMHYPELLPYEEEIELIMEQINNM